MKSNSVHKAYALTIIVAFLVLLSSCQTQSSDFKKAKEQNTIESYQVFIENYPEGEFSLQARQLLEELEFKKTLAIGTIESYDAFLEDYPEGKFAPKIVHLLDESHLNEAVKANNIESYSYFLKSYPESKFISSVESRLIGLKIEELYKKASRDPKGDLRKDLIKALNGPNPKAGINNWADRSNKAMEEFNKEASVIVKADKYLTKYFNELIPKLDSDEKLTLDNLNYGNPGLRKTIEKDLGVDIIVDYEYY